MIHHEPPHSKARTTINIYAALAQAEANTNTKDSNIFHQQYNIKTMTDELVLIEPKLPVPIEQKVASAIAAFEQKKSELQELVDAYKDLRVTDISNPKQLKAVSDARKLFKKERCAIEGDGRDIRKNIKTMTDQVTVKEKELVGIISPTEDVLQAEEDRVEAEKEAIRVEAERKEQERINARVKAALDAGCLFDGETHTIGAHTLSRVGLQVAEDEKFARFIEAAKAEQAIQAEAEKERLRIEAEAKETERLRVLAEQEQIRKDREELAALRQQQEEVRLANEKEATRLREEKEAQERAAKEVEQARINAIVSGRVAELTGKGLVMGHSHYSHPLYDCTAIAKEILVDASQSDWEETIALLDQRIEEGKKAVEAKRLAEIEEAKEQARLAEQARLELESIRKEQEAEAARLETLRIAALAPDKEKLLLFSDTIGKLEVPEMSTDAAKEIATQVKLLIGKIQSHILTKTKAL